MAGESVWDRYFEKKGYVSDYDERYFNFVKSSRNLPKKSKVLEAGCGSGRTLINFKDSFVVALDINKTALIKARHNLIEQSHGLVLGDIQNLPFKGNKFTLVYNSGVIEHFKYPKDFKAVSEMTRVLKNRGRLIIIVPNSLCLWYVFGKKIAQILGKWRYGYEGSYNPHRLNKLVRKAGLKDVSNTGLLLFPPSNNGFNQIYPKTFSKIFKKIEKVLGRFNAYFAYALVVTGRKYSF